MQNLFFQCYDRNLSITNLRLMSNPYKQLEQLIQTADVANANFAKAEIDAARWYESEIAIFANEASERKRSAYIFWRTHIRDVDDYLIQMLGESLNKYGYFEEKQELQFKKFKPSDAINDWKPDESMQSDIHEMIRASRRLAYEAYTDWLGVKQTIEKINIGISIGIVIMALIVFILYLRS